MEKAVEEWEWATTTVTEGKAVTTLCMSYFILMTLADELCLYLQLTTGSR